MGRVLRPKCKQCRRVGEKLFLKGDRCLGIKCAIVKRNFPPGIHGASGSRRRISEYGLQLKEKQRAKAMYRLGEKQFLNYYKSAIKSKENTGEELLSFLERRLDNVVFRLGLATSRDQAKQLVSHGHVYLNGRKLDVPSYSVKKGDAIKLKEKSQTIGAVVEAVAKRAEEIPDWLAFETKGHAGTVIALPDASELNLGIEVKLIIEYYSR